MTDKRQQLFEESTRWVVKIGSALLTNEGRGLDTEAIVDWVRQMAQLRGENIELVLVSSGSVAAGMQRLGLQERPSALHELQAAAAVGQMGLVQTYESAFQQHAIHTAQILLTHDDLSNRKRYLNARSTLRSLLDMGVVPVVNENDTVVTDEIRFGDNDTLGALVANLIEADLLIILTDQQGLYTKNPSQFDDAELVQEAQADDESLFAMAGEGGRLGRGGMITKVRAANLAARSGAATLIASGRESDVLLRARKAESLGTLLWPSDVPDAARKQWLAGHLQLAGRLVLDDGAVKALVEGGNSLLPVGVKLATGDFMRGEVVACFDQAGREVARGLANYSLDEVQKIMGQPSGQIEALLGYINEPELIHRDNLVLV